MAASWETIRDECLGRRQAAIPKEYLLPDALLQKLPTQSFPRDLSNVVDTASHFTEAEIRIVNAPARTILSNVKDGAWSSVEVTQAFCKAAAVANQLTNCLTEVFFDAALRQAKFLDDYQRDNKKVIGPLHGLPISLKDSFFLPGMPSSIGLANLAREPAKSITPLAKIMSDLGAIFYVKTNVPMAMAMCETINRIWGETVNPWGFSPGGSSGGEGCIVSMKGSPLGIGTDLGGSVRLPSGFCGLYGFKPSAKRMSMRGHQSALAGVDMVPTTCGPLSRSLDTIELWLEVVTSEPRLWALDHNVVPLLWRPHDVELNRNRKLRIGVIRETDGVVTVHPPISRAIEEVVAALQADGHDVFEWEPKGHKELSDLFFGNAIHHGQALFQKIGDSAEPLFTALKLFESGNAPPFSAATQRELTTMRYGLCDTYFDRWAATATDGKPEMDAILTPFAPWVMPPLGAYQTKFNLSFTNFANVLDAPAVTIPVTTVDKSIDLKRASFEPLSQMDADIQADYDPEAQHGAPVCIQLVGKRLQEERLLGVAKKVDALVKAK